MSTRKNPTKEEIRVATDRAERLYFDHIKDQLTEADKNRYVAIDGNTGEWEIGDVSEEVTERLRARVPDALIHKLRHITLAVEYIGAVPEDLKNERLAASYVPGLADEREEFGR